MKKILWKRIAVIPNKKIAAYRGWRRKIALLLIVVVWFTMFPDLTFVEAFTKSKEIQMVQAEEAGGTSKWDGEYPSAVDEPWMTQGTGDGTADKPYQITSAKDLAQFSYNVSDGSTYDGIYFILTTDIDLNGESWKPIGYDGTNTKAPNGDNKIYGCFSFKGIFDGDGHSITGLAVSGSYQTAGLFSRLGNSANSIAEIKSLNVSGSVMTEYPSSRTLVGGIVAYLEYATIRNCSANVTVSAVHQYSYGYDTAVGGIVGSMGVGGLLVNCVAAGNVSGPEFMPLAAGNANKYSLGGLVGHVGNASTKITNCYAMGNVFGPGSETFVGGFLGNDGSSATLKLEYCYWNSEASQGRYGDSGTKTNYGHGKSDTTFKSNQELYLYSLPKAAFKSSLILDTLNGLSGLENIRWKEEGGIPILTKDTNPNPHYGLLAGVFDKNGADGTKGNPYTITEPFQMTLLSYWVNNTAGFMAGKYIQLKENLDMESLPTQPIGVDASKAFQGKIDGAGHTISGLNVRGGNAYTGLFGYVGTGGEIVSLTIKGSIGIGIFLTAAPSPVYIGGVAGYFEGTIKNCFADVSVTASTETYTNTGVVVGYAGGVIGYAQSGTVVNCFSKGTVTNKKSTSSNNYCGGFVGYDMGSYYANCFALSNVKRVESAKGGMFAGAIGESSSTYSIVRNCFWSEGTQLMKLDGTASSNQKGAMGSSTSTAVVTSAEILSLQSQETINLMNACSGLTDCVWVNTTEHNNEDYPCLIPGMNTYAKLPLGFCDAGDADGTKAKPYTISTALQLQALAYKSDLESSQLKGKYIKLKNNIDLEEIDFTPIAIGHSGMNYIFDGAGNEINGLKVNGYYQYAGLFARADTNGVIQNLGVKGEVTNQSTYASDSGGIVGNNRGTISCSYADVTIDHKGTGGIGGTVGGNDNSGVVSSSYSVGKVNGAAGAEVGGLIGRNDGTIQISFWNTEIDQKVGGILQSPARGIGNNVGDVIPVTSDELKSADVLDIMNICCAKDNHSWQVNNTKNNGYPYLSNTQNPYDSLADGVFTDGDGSKGNPYTITTWEQLYALAAKVSRGEDYSTNFIQLEDHIDLSSLPFLPIGIDTATSFMGNFNGKGYTISGLQMERTGANTGFFGTVGKDGVIRHLLVEGSVNSTSNAGNVGGIVGLGSSATISGCSFRGSVQGNINANVGGLVGKIEKSSAIKGSYVSAGITGGAGAVKGGVIGVGSTAAVLEGVLWDNGTALVGAGVGNGVGETSLNAMATSELQSLAACNHLNNGLKSRDVYWGQNKFVNDGFPNLKEMQELGGFVRISGTIAFGETLTANTTGLTKADDAGNWNYQWTRDGVDIDGADEATYSLKKEDIGTVVNVTVYADYSQTKSSAQTAKVAKASQLCQAQAISVQLVTSDMIILDSIDGIEFCLQGGDEWVSIPMFTGLSADTEYSFMVRKAETKTHNASAEVFALSTVKTNEYLAAKFTQDAPVSPNVLSQTETQVILTEIENAEYSLDAIIWQDQTSFSGLTPGQTYSFYARYKENATYHYSNPSLPLTVTLNKQNQTPPSAPLLVSKTDSIVVLKNENGIQYRIGTDGTWQDSSAFIDLKAEQEYTFYARRAETDNSYASEASTVLTVCTNKANAGVAITYIIVFDLNNAKGTEPKTQYRQPGEKITNPSEPKRTGYLFTGWYREKECKTKWQFASNIVTGNTILYAGWVKIPGITKLSVSGGYKKVTLTWKEVSGSDGYQIYRATSKKGKYTKIKTITSGNKVSFTDKNRKKGKNYCYKIRAYVNVDGQKKVGSYCKIKSKKVPDLYKVTFVVNGGTKVATTYVKNNKRLPAPKRPLRKGYTFRGWYTNAKKTKKYDFTTKVKKNRKLYAKWVLRWKIAATVDCLTTKNQVRLVWNEVKGVKGYEIVRKTEGKTEVFTKVAVKDGVVIFTDRDLKQSQSYSYRVRAYKLVNGKKVYGSYSRIMTSVVR